MTPPVGPRRRRAEAWIGADPDPATRAGLRHLLDGGDELIGEDGPVTTDGPASDTIVLGFDQLPTEGAVLANLAGRNPRLGDIVTIRVAGVDVTSAIVAEGQGDGAFGLRLTDLLAEEPAPPS